MSKVLQETAPKLSAGEYARKGALYHVVKRLLDIVIAASALAVTGPLILLGALAVKLSSRGPAFYRAKRAGLEGRPFVMF